MRELQVPPFIHGVPNDIYPHSSRDIITIGPNAILFDVLPPHVDKSTRMSFWTGIYHIERPEIAIMRFGPPNGLHYAIDSVHIRYIAHRGNAKFTCHFGGKISNFGPAIT